MGLFNFLRGADINQGVEEQRDMKGSILIDVRNEDEYRSGHIPQSRNIPLPLLNRIKGLVKDRAVPLYVYCYSGSRSRQACTVLKDMGYTNVKNIGGISAWKGKVER